MGVKNFGEIDKKNRNFIFIDQLIDKVKNKDNDIVIKQKFITLNKLLKNNATKYNYIDLMEANCIKDRCKLFDDEYNVLSYDGGHLTKSGAKYFANKLTNLEDLILN